MGEGDGEAAGFAAGMYEVTSLIPSVEVSLLSPPVVILGLDCIVTVIGGDGGNIPAPATLSAKKGGIFEIQCQPFSGVPGISSLISCDETSHI